MFPPAEKHDFPQFTLTLPNPFVIRVLLRGSPFQHGLLPKRFNGLIETWLGYDYDYCCHYVQSYFLYFQFLKP